MSAFARANLTVRTGETTRYVTRQFVGASSRRAMNFAGCTLALSWGFPSGLAAVAVPVLVLTHIASANGRIRPNCPDLGYLEFEITPAGAAILLQAGAVLQHLLKVTSRGGAAKDFIEGATAVVPGW